MRPRETSVILCGGRGSRMADATGAYATKHMLMLGEESVIGRLVRQLSAGGIRDHVIIVPGDSDALVKHLGPMAAARSMRLIATVSNKVGDLLLGLREALTATKTIVMLMGDCVFHDREIDSFLQIPMPPGADLLVGANLPHPGASDVYVLGNVDGLSRETPSPYVSAGIYRLRSQTAPVLLRPAYAREESMCRLLDAAVRDGLRARRFDFSAAYDLNTPENYRQALATVAR